MKEPEWREFEKLVARIEETAAPADVRVKSPDRIADLVTGTLREVDASIRLSVDRRPPHRITMWYRGPANGSGKLGGALRCSPQGGDTLVLVRE